MFARRLVLPSKCVLNKGISNVVFIYNRSAIFSINSLINAHFSTGKFVEKYYVLPLSLMNNINVKKPFLSVVEKWKPLHRFYSGDASVTFLSGGKSKHFESNPLYGEDKVLNRVVEQLQDDNGIDICVIETSEERQKYADYVVVVSGRSTRHLKAMTNHIYQQSKKDFPQKRVIVTGVESDNWMIVDFGSIVIHLFLPEIREKYELEKLWSLGPEHDKQYQEMLEDDRHAEMVKNAKLQDFFVNEEPSK